MTSQTEGTDTQASGAVAIVSDLPKNILSRPAPGDNFYLFANNFWVSDVQISHASLSAGALEEARTRTRNEIAALEANLLAGDWPKGSDERKYQTLYNTFLNERRVNRTGLGPIRDGLQRIRGARDHRSIAALMGNYRLDAGGLFAITLKVSQREGYAYVPQLGPARPLLGLPASYLRDDAEAEQLRIRGVDLLASLLRRGSGRRKAQARAQAVIDLETKLAHLAPSASAERNPAHSQRLFTREDLETLAPQFPWQIYLASHGLGGESRLSLAPFEDLVGITDVFRQTPVSVWRDYLTLHLMVRYGAYLPERIAITTEQISQLRSATSRPLPSRAERASRFAQWVMPDVLARKYTEDRLTLRTRQMVETMAEQMRAAYRRRIMNANWLSPQTRNAALEKLEALHFMIGKPPVWNDFSAYEPRHNDLFANAYAKLQVRHLSMLSRHLERLPEGGRNVDTLRRNIYFASDRVGAYYLPRLNAIVLPAAYLQPPFFDPEADPARNFGALGTTLGHEIGHAFDDQGSQFGPGGAFENWWTADDRARFNTLARKLSSQFSGLEAAPGIPLDTQLTLGENFSDLAGLETALDALLMTSAQTGAGEDADARRAMLQTFFLSYADKRRRIRRPETDRQFALHDRHSPPELRTNIVLSNMDLWYEAFGIDPSETLYRPPRERLSIWSSDNN